MVDFQNPTLEQIEVLIPDKDRHFAKGLGNDWCHPKQLRQLRDIANRVVRKKTPETHSAEHTANWWLDEQPNNIFDLWGKLIQAWLDFDQMIGRGNSAYDCLVFMVIGNLGINWKYFEAPMIVWRKYNES